MPTHHAGVAELIVDAVSRPVAWMVAGNGVLGAITSTQKAIGALVLVAVVAFGIGLNLDSIRSRVMGGANAAESNTARIVNLESTTATIRTDLDAHVAEWDGVQRAVLPVVTEAQSRVSAIEEVWCERFPEDCETIRRLRGDL